MNLALESVEMLQNFKVPELNVPTKWDRKLPLQLGGNGKCQQGTSARKYFRKHGLLVDCKCDQGLNTKTYQTTQGVKCENRVLLQT